MYALCDFHIVSLFSFRTLHSNAFAAQTLPCPTPAGVKLALLAKLLERDGGDSGQAHLDWLAPLEVCWRPPAMMAVGAATVRIYKSDAADKPLTGSVGMREYAHSYTSFALALGPVAAERRADLTFALGQLRALGNAESLVQPLGPPTWHDEPPQECANLTSDMETGSGYGYAVVLDDLGYAPAWTRLNGYREHDRRLIPQIGADRVRRIVTLPLNVVRWSESGYVLSANVLRQ